VPAIILFVVLLSACKPEESGFGAARCVEIEVEMDMQTEGGSGHATTAKCVVGSNAWFICGHFPKNAFVEYWLVDTNLVNRTTITDGMYVERVEDFLSSEVLGRKSRYAPLRFPALGTTNLHIFPCPNRAPTGGRYVGAV
jgi:hypothetical protein